MYKLLKKLNITDRIVNEDNDYLLEDEYKKLENIYNEFSDLKYVIDVYHKYCDTYINLDKDDVYVLQEITIVRPNKYTTSNYNSITFNMNIYSRETGDYITYRNLKEEGFTPNFIKDMYKRLCSLTDKTDYVSASRDSDYDTYRIFYFSTRRHMDNPEERSYYIDDLKKYEGVEKLLNHFKDRTISIPKDENFEKDIKEIYDLFENL